MDMPEVRIYSEAGPEMDEPTDEQIVATLRTLHDVGNPFAVLEVGEDFIQALREADGTYRLEYRDHATGEVLHAVTPAPTLPQVEQAFLAFRRGDLAWAKRFSWEPLSTRSSGCLGGLVVLIGLAAVTLIV